MNKELEDELLKAMKSLLSDIESMQQTNDTYFGPFREDGWDTARTNIEWPNLAISAQALKDVLAKIASQERKDTPPYWHKNNPWKDQLIYVPIEELAECALSIGHNGRTKEQVLDQWSQYGIWLDAYILTGPIMTAGIRFSSEEADYLSPGFNPHMLKELLNKHRSKP